jgi:SSS family solute:Na+ symporter
VLGASIYFCFTFVPMFIAYSATLIDPALFKRSAGEGLATGAADAGPAAHAAVRPGAVLRRRALGHHELLLGDLLAPSVTFAENVLKGFYPTMGDHQFLRVMRGCLVGFACMVLVVALKSEASIFKMVENAYKVTLAGAFVPLAAGIFWRRATTQGALAAIFGGLLSWVLIEVLIGEASPVPPQLIGLGVSLLMTASLLPHRPPPQDPHAILHHHAAAQTHHAEPEHKH